LALCSVLAGFLLACRFVAGLDCHAVSGFGKLWCCIAGFTSRRVTMLSMKRPCGLRNCWRDY